MSEETYVTARGDSRRADRPGLPALTGLRIYAALFVVAYHFLRPRVSQIGGVGQLAGSGYVGVSLFFVLSGFILTYTYRQAGARVGTRRFLWARLARVYPVYLVSLAVAYPFFSHRTPEAVAHRLAPFVIALVQAWLPGGACKWNCPGWTLSAEMFFYLLFPVALAFLERLQPSRRWAVTLACWAGAVVVNVCVSTLFPRNPQLTIVMEYLPAIRFPEFALGVVAGMSFIDGYRLRVSSAAVLCTTACALLVVGYLPYLVVHNGLLGPLFAALVLAIAGGESRIERHLSTRTMVFAGRASYAVYLLHVPIYDVLRQALKHGGVSIDVSWGAFGAYLIVLAAASAIVLTCVEEPARKWLRGVIMPPSSHPSGDQSRARLSREAHPVATATR